MLETRSKYSRAVTWYDLPRTVSDLTEGCPCMSYFHTYRPYFLDLSPAAIRRPPMFRCPFFLYPQNPHRPITPLLGWTPYAHFRPMSALCISQSKGRWRYNSGLIQGVLHVESDKALTQRLRIIASQA